MHAAQRGTRIAGTLLSAAALLGGVQTAAAAGPAGTADVLDVATAGERKAALAAAGPGDEVRMADGTYRGNSAPARAARTSTSRKAPPAPGSSATPSTAAA